MQFSPQKMVLSKITRLKTRSSLNLLIAVTRYDLSKREAKTALEQFIFHSELEIHADFFTH